MRFDKTLYSPYFFIITVSFIIVSYFFFDQHITYFFKHFTTQTDTQRYAELITQFGKSSYYLILLIGLWLLNYLWLHIPSLQRRVNFLFLAISLSGILCFIIKILLARARPTLLLTDHVYGFYFLKTNTSFLSFPSGHSTTIAALMMSLSLLFKRFTPLFLILLVLICSTRILLHAHFLSDIIAGIYLGALTSSYVYWKMNIAGSKQ